MSSPAFRIANPSEYPRIAAVYEDWGYGGGVASEDVVYVAERDETLLGVVRRTLEHNLTMLRGMYIAPVERRRSLGSQLLRVFTADLKGVECFCVPYAHLKRFYAQAGFTVVSDTMLPEFLRDRVMEYRRRGLDVCVMCRRADPTDPGSAGNIAEFENVNDALS